MGALQKRFREALASAKTTGRPVNNPTRLAKALGITQPSVHQFLTGKAQRWRHTLDSARHLGVRVEWLERGSGPMLDDDPPAITTRRRGDTVTDSQSRSVVEIDLRAGAGGGGIAPSLAESAGDRVISTEITKGHWQLPDDYLRELGVRPARAFVVEIKGDSMSPTLESGDRVMVDMEDRTPSPPGVFALWDGIGLVVKRLDPVLDDGDDPKIAIISDNAKHRAYERTMAEINIIGRVVLRASRM